MIKLNDAKIAQFTLVMPTDEQKQNNEILKNFKEPFYIDQENKKVYLNLNYKTQDKRRELITKLSSFVMVNFMDINIDLDSFIKNFSDNESFGEEKLFNAVVETISYVSHPAIVIKKENKQKPDYVYNIQSSNKNFVEIFDKEIIKSELVNYARDLQDTPPNIGTSEYFANKIEEDSKAFKNVKLTVLGIKEAKKLNMGLFLAVNAASTVEPKVVIAEYNGDPSKEKTVLVGKGITFDTGGMNLKPGNYMVSMKYDMSGAAIMLSTVLALAKANAKANVAAVGMFTDNRIGQNATLPESVVTSMNGLTVQIDNTDAEGRLVLADGLTYAVRNLNADKLIEASTLTGAIEVALGHWATGAFTKDDKLWEAFNMASEFTGERAWRMPIYPEHLEKMQDTPIADLTNSEPGREAGSSTAAAFLNEFAENKPYLHLDIAGTADNKKRGTGVMVKTLFELLAK